MKKNNDSNIAEDNKDVCCEKHEHHHEHEDHCGCGHDHNHHENGCGCGCGCGCEHSEGNEKVLIIRLIAGAILFAAGIVT